MRLMSLALTASLLSLCAPAARADDPLEWTFIYWMAYDNNLQGCGPPILKMLKAGVTSPKIAVACWSDFRDREGMFRTVFRAGAEPQTVTIDREGSAEEENVAEALDWARANLPARKYALVFLDHGGGLSMMSYDEHPGRRGGQNWLVLPEVGEVVRGFREKVKQAGSEVELVFLQQCGKGTLENYHCFRSACRWVMGSQTVVGAPNRYYQATLEWVGQHPEASGLDLAKKITETETDDMFTTYTTVSCAALESLAGKLEPVLAPLLEKSELKPGQGLKDCFDFEKELFHDGFAWLQALYAANGVDAAPRLAFEEWVKKELVVSHRVSPKQTERAGTWCGFSLYTPPTDRLLERYRAKYPIYAQTKLDELMEKLASATVPAGQEKEPTKK